MFGCEVARQRVSTLVEHTDPGLRAVRLESPRETLEQWIKRDNGGVRSFMMDIYGGGYPSELRAMKPCR